MNTWTEEGLAAALDEHAGTLHAPDAILHAAVRGARRRARRRVAAASIGGLALAASVVVALVTAPGLVSSREPAVNATFVFQNVTRALPALDRSVYHRVIDRTITLSDGQRSAQRLETWFAPGLDKGVNRLWIDGTVQAADARTYAGGVETFLEVDYPRHTWRRWSQTVAPNVTRDFSGLAVGAPDIKAALQGKGTFTLVGQEHVAGHQTYHLRATSTDPAHPQQVDLWADAHSYQLLKASTSGGGGLQNASYEWYAPTPEALAHLDFTPPSGFRQTR